MRTIVFVFAALVELAQPAYADENDELNTWYLGLHNPGGTLCCDKADCHSIQSRLQDSKWMAHIVQADIRLDKWVEVPERVILRNAANITDQALGCWLAYSNAYINWYCFVPPPEY